jgi:hypothetical protein
LKYGIIHAVVTAVTYQMTVKAWLEEMEEQNALALQGPKEPGLTNR